MKKLTIGLVTGEASGDNLAADLICALQTKYEVSVVGVVGPKVQALGGTSLYDMNTLSVMGFFEPAKRLPKLISIRTNLIKYFTKNPPDVFIGVDSPDFNLGLELALKKKNIKTVHYVSPSVWAWRQGRINKIKKAVDLMLTLFPFELSFYQKFGVNAACVGHPLADQISLELDVEQARDQLQLSGDKKIIAILPGSRANEIRYMAPTFLNTANALVDKGEQVCFVIPFVNEVLQKQFDLIKQHIAPKLNIQYFSGKAREVMLASDAILITSGTATLEAMLLKKPMVVAYKMSWPTYQIAKMVIKTPFVALPNLLFNKAIAPEYIQQDAEPEKLATALQVFLHDAAVVADIKDQFLTMHQQLRGNASQRACFALEQLLSKPI